MHHHGYIHRDIKPENILVNVGLGGKVTALKIADFGEACPIDDKCKELGLGTPGYLAPEMMVKI